jgi:hypothetical protein
MSNRSGITMLAAVLSAASPCAMAQMSVSSDLHSFSVLYPAHALVDFDKLAPTTELPLNVDDVIVEAYERYESAGPQVVDSLLGSPHAFWFSGVASAPNFILVNGKGIQAWLPRPARSIGLTVQCFSCDAPNPPSMFRFELLNANDQVVARVDEVLELRYPGSRFVAVHSRVPFRRVRISREQGDREGNYMIDDLRIAYAVDRKPCARNDQSDCACASGLSNGRRCK